MNTLADSQDPSASLPHLLEKLLQQQSIDYQLRPTPHAVPGSQQVQACLLCDAIGSNLKARHRLSEPFYDVKRQYLLCLERLLKAICKAFL